MMQLTRQRKTTIHTRNVPADTKAQFKAYCARRGYTMEDAIIALIKKAARENTPLPDARKKTRVNNRPNTITM